MEWFTEFNIKEQVFIRFIWEVAYFYKRNKNPFHNFSHAVSVCHAGFYLIKKYPKFSSLLTDHQKFGFIISCLGHDLDHRGLTNNFEIATQSELAIRYHDMSPLEQHHAAILFSILSVKGSNVMHDIKGDQWRTLKKSMIENILATDMKSHFSMLTKFKTHLLENKSFGETPCPEADRQLITDHFIHYCDLSGSFKNFGIASRWSKLVNMEFSRQVDASLLQYEREIELGLAPTPHFKDLNKEEVFYSSEINFIKFIVLPLFDLSNSFLDETLVEEKKCLTNNLDSYSEKLKLIEDSRPEECQSPLLVSIKI